MSDRPRYLLEIDAEIRERQEDQEEIERLTRERDYLQKEVNAARPVVKGAARLCHCINEFGHDAGRYCTEWVDALEAAISRYEAGH